MERATLSSYASVDDCRDWLHRAGWSVGEARFGPLWQVNGRNGERAKALAPSRGDQVNDRKLPLTGGAAEGPRCRHQCGDLGPKPSGHVTAFSLDGGWRCGEDGGRWAGAGPCEGAWARRRALLTK